MFKKNSQCLTEQDSTDSETLTQTDAAVLQQVTQVVKHGALVLSADAAKVTQETAAVGHHLGKSDLLEKEMQQCDVSCILQI